jgi:hypothetical protein
MGSIIMGRFKFLLFVLLLVTISFSATTWYVSTTGNDATGDGSAGNPYLTLNKTIKTAVAGDTILVADGTYHDLSYSNVFKSLYIDKALIVRASNYSKVFVSVNASAVDYVFYINSDGVVLDGMVLNGFGDQDDAERGVYIYQGKSYINLTNLELWNLTTSSIEFRSNGCPTTGVNNVIISNTTFINASQYHIFFAGSCHENITILNNTIYFGYANIEYGIVSTVGTATPKNTVIENNTFNFVTVNSAWSSNAILLQTTVPTSGQKDAKIKGNYFGNSTNPFVGTPVYFVNMVNMSIYNNTFHAINTSTTSRYAVYLLGYADNTTIANNTFGSIDRNSSMNQSAIRADDASNIIVANNTFYLGMNAYGIWMMASSRAVNTSRIENNSFYEQGPFQMRAIYLNSTIYNLSDFIIHNNEFGSATTPLYGYGVYASNAVNLNITHNRFFMNESPAYDSGIYLINNATRAYIQNNTFGSSTYYTNLTSGTAIEIMNAQESKIFNNTVYSENTTYSVKLKANNSDVLGPLIEENLFLSNKNYSIYGIYIDIAGSNSIYDVRIHNNSFGSSTSNYPKSAIYSQTTSRVNVTANRFFVQDNPLTTGPIYFTGVTDNVTVENNTFGSSINHANLSGTAMVQILSSENALVKNNTFYIYNAVAVVLDATSKNVSNPLITTNTVYGLYNDVSYGIRLGEEGTMTYGLFNGSVEYNTLTFVMKTLTAAAGDVLHDVLLGYTFNSRVQYNNLSGGYYGLVIKGNYNGTVFANNVYNASYYGIFDKAGHNCSFYNNTIDASGDVGGAALLSWNNVDGKYVFNSTWWNNTFYVLNNTVSKYPIAIYNNTNVTEYHSNNNYFVLSRLTYQYMAYHTFGYNPRHWLSVTGMDHNSFFCVNNLSNCSHIDVIPPTVTFVAPTPSNNSNLSKTWIDVNVTTADAFAISNVTVYIYNSSGSLVTSNSSSISNSSFFTNFTGLANGVYYLNATINDTSGNNNTAGTLNITLDTVSPAINFVFPTDATNTSLNITNLVINVTATDSLSGLKNLTIFLYNESGVLENTSNTTSSPLFVNFTGLRNGIYYFNATAFDQANNSNSTATWNVTIDNVAPYFNATYIPSADYYTADQTQTFAFVINDAYSRTMNCSVYIDGTNVHTNSTVTNATKLIFDYSLALGKHNWSATCRDIANNTNSTDTRNFTIVARATSTGSGSSESKTVLYPKTKFDCFTGKITIDVGEANGEVLQLMKEGVPPSIITTKTITDGKVEFIIPSSGTYSIVPYQFTSKYVLSISTETYTLCPATTETPEVTTPVTPEVIVLEVTPEETPAEVTVTSITKEEVLVIISSADSAINIAAKENKDVSTAKAKLTEANVLIASGDLEGAKKLAEEALALVKSAKAKATTPATTSAATTTTQSGGLDLGTILLIGAVVVIMIVGIYYFTKSEASGKQKGQKRF